MLTVGLLRHGETVGGDRFRGHTDDPLTPTGWAQMQAAIDAGDHWDQVVSSPLQRCARFARSYARLCALPLRIDGRLKELYFGRWEGRSAAELMVQHAAALARFWADPQTHPPPDGERLTDFQARVLAAWDDIVAERSGQRVLVVTHGGVIRVLLCHVQGLPLTHLQAFAVEHGHLHHLRFDSDGLTEVLSPANHVG